jgi:hypothetical protein
MSGTYNLEGQLQEIEKQFEGVSLYSIKRLK